MFSPGRYARLLAAFGRYSLARELAFRGNFLINMVVEILWLSILLFFYRLVFQKTPLVAGWSEEQYLFFVGCYFALEGVMETLFLENCSQFADLVRTGDLDFYLLKPIDEQFLVSCRNISWSSGASFFMGVGVMVVALSRLPEAFDLVRALIFLVMFGCGVAISYSFLLLLTSTSIWFVRNQSLYEMWWLFTNLVRYPREIFNRPWADPIARLLTFVIPIMLVINVPANVMVRTLQPGIVGFTLLATAGLLFLSRRFFLFSLRRYRSASS